eukprot:5641791-Pleurochrysis_carterae.AAC.2
MWSHDRTRYEDGLVDAEGAVGRARNSDIGVSTSIGLYHVPSSHCLLESMRHISFMERTGTKLDRRISRVACTVQKSC